MKKIIVIITSLLFYTTHAQTSSSKIKIVLMAVQHFDNPGKDVLNPEMDDVLAPRRQKEIEDVTNQLAKLRFDKIYIEAMPERQKIFDSLYQFDYAKQLSTKRDERKQIGFRLAHKLNLKKLYCVDADGDWFFDSVTVYAKAHNQYHFIENEMKKAKKFIAGSDSVMKKSTINSLLRYLNQPQQLIANHSFYNNMLAFIGDTNNHIGADLVGEWYKRNVRIYSNIIHSLDGTEKKLFLFFGQGHIHYLKQLFNANPAFEVVEFNDVVK